MIKKYDSIVNNDIKQLIKDSDWVEDIVHYGLFNNQLDGTEGPLCLSSQGLSISK